MFNKEIKGEEVNEYIEGICQAVLRFMAAIENFRPEKHVRTSLECGTYSNETQLRQISLCATVTVYALADFIISDYQFDHFSRLLISEEVRLDL